MSTNYREARKSKDHVSRPKVPGKRKVLNENKGGNRNEA